MLTVLICRCSTIRVVFFIFPPFLYMFYMLELPTVNTYYLHRETKETIQNWQRSADRPLVGLILDLQLPSVMGDLWPGHLSLCLALRGAGRRICHGPKFTWDALFPIATSPLACVFWYLFLPSPGMYSCVPDAPRIVTGHLSGSQGGRKIHNPCPVVAKPNVVLAWLWFCCYWDRLESPLALGVAKRMPLVLISREAGWQRIVESACPESKPASVISWLFGPGHVPSGLPRWLSW